MNLQKIVLRGSLVLWLCALGGTVCAQRLSVRTNALGWASLSPNAGVELTLSDRVSLAFNASMNPWQSEQWQARHLSLCAEVRYWMARPSIGHFIAAGPAATAYDLRVDGKGYRGDMLALGVGYGYSLPLGRRWNFEPQIMVGYGCLREFSSAGSSFSPARVRWMPMVTRMGLSFVYIIK